MGSISDGLYIVAERIMEREKVAGRRRVIVEAQLCWNKRRAAIEDACEELLRELLLSQGAGQDCGGRQLQSARTASARGRRKSCC